ncbi:MAG TPA: hypothetical protein VFB93_04725 [Burkholderiales bacterium]|nr:hypothetical protein [Burkholderiales bacterium]
MSHLVRIAALLAAFAAAGCISNAEVSPTSAVSTESSSLYAEMHAAIPAAARDNVLEYH